MLSLLLSAALTLAASAHVAQAQTAQTPPPTAEEIKAAVAEINDAFIKGKTPERVQAIQKNARIVDAKVIECVGKGLKDGDVLVLDAAIEALRFMKHPDALDALQAAVKREKRLEKLPESLAKLFKAIAQHGNPKSIPLLADGVFSLQEYKVIEARVLGLANIRDKQSVEQLVALMRVAGREKVQPYMGHFRIALMLLTGVDQGVSQDTWMSWWNNHKDDFTVAPTPPPLPKDMQNKWDYFWGNEVERPRGKKRGERGDDR